MDNKAYKWIIVSAVLFIAGIGGGYFYFSKKSPPKPVVAREAQERGVSVKGDMFMLRIYYPLSDRLQMEERNVQKETSLTAVIEAAIEEFLKGPVNSQASVVPMDARLLGLYKGNDGVLYVDLSDEFRRNFGGDVIAEFMLLKGFFESLISNAHDISDVKILIEGRETESLGGHMYILYPLKDTVSSDPPESLARK